MPKSVTVRLDDNLYLALVDRAGGPRKISKYLDTLLRAALAGPTGDIHADVAALYQRLADFEQRIGHLETICRE